VHERHRALRSRRTGGEHFGRNSGDFGAAPGISVPFRSPIAASDPFGSVEETPISSAFP
jgi:hypothetical protein